VLEGGPLAVADVVVRLAPVAQEQQVVATTAINRAAASVVRMDRVVATATVDVVGTVAGVDEVVASAAIQPVVLASGLAARLEITPEHIRRAPAVDGVVAVAAEELITAVRAPNDSVLVVRMALVSDRFGPAVVAGIAPHEAGEGDRQRQGD